MNNVVLAGFIKKQVQKYEGGADLESNKSVSITQNGTTLVQPSSGKDGMEQVTVNVNVSGGGADLEDNKEVTIKENGTVEITPTEGKDGMKKVTATVNVPSGGSATAYIWQQVDSRTPMTSKYAYMSVDVAPADQTEALTMKNLSGDLLAGTLSIASIPSMFTYTRISDTKFELSAVIGGNPITLTYTRDTTREDVVIWGKNEGLLI